MELRKYQNELIEKIINELNDEKKRICVQLGTGGGKTVIFSYLINNLLHEEKVLILFDSIELIKSFKKINSNTKIDIWMIESFFNRLKKNKITLDKYTFLIVDECHTGNFIKLYKELKNQYLIGFSATPMFSNSKEKISDYFESLVIGETNENLIKQGYLCESVEIIPEEKILMSRNYKFSKISDFSIAEMEKEVNNIDYFENVYSEIKKNNIDGLKLCYLVSINHCNNFYNFLKNKGEICYIVTSINKEDRENILEVKKGYIITCGSLKKGYDNKNIEAVIHLYATTSLTNYLQKVGRGSRPNEGKKFFINLDFGQNVLYFGRFSKNRDWIKIFYEDKKFTNEKILKKCENCGEIIERDAKICICGEVIFFEDKKTLKKSNEKKFLFSTPETFNLNQLFENSYKITENKILQINQKVYFDTIFEIYFTCFMNEIFFKIDKNYNLILNKRKYNKIMLFFLKEIDFKKIENFIKNLNICYSNFRVREEFIKQYFKKFMWGKYKKNLNKNKCIKKINYAISKF